MLKIIGAKGVISDVDSFLKQIGSFAQKHNLVVQAFNSDVIYGINHLNSAFEHAVRAMDRKTNTTKSLEMEILLYASGERQLKNAIPKMGVKKGKANIAILFSDGKISDKMIEDILNQLALVRNDKVLDGDENTLKNFGITKNEIETVTKDKYGHIILEKVAMLDIIK